MWQTAIGTGSLCAGEAAAWAFSLQGLRTTRSAVSRRAQHRSQDVRDSTGFHPSDEDLADKKRAGTPIVRGRRLRNAQAETSPASKLFPEVVRLPPAGLLWGARGRRVRREPVPPGGLPMPAQGRALPQPPTAAGTAVGPVPRLRPPMLPDALGAVRTPAGALGAWGPAVGTALRTPVRLLARVGPLVGPEVGRVVEALAAVQAPERPVARVSPLVPGQAPAPAEALPADAALVRVLLLTRGAAPEAGAPREAAPAPEGPVGPPPRARPHLCHGSPQVSRPARRLPPSRPLQGSPRSARGTDPSVCSPGIGVLGSGPSGLFR